MFMVYSHWFPILDSLSEEGKGTAEIQYVLLNHFNKLQGHCHRIRNL